MPKKKGLKFYAVAKGYKTGIYKNWEECRAQVDGCSGAKYQSFPTRELAEHFISSSPIAAPQKRKIEADVEVESTSNAVKKARYDGEVIYTDGSAIGNGSNASRAGIGVFFGAGDSRNISKRLSGRQTNQRAELSAIICALEGALGDVVVRSDSQYSINCLTKWHQSWSRNGWKTKTGVVENKDLIQRALTLIQKREKEKKKTVLEKVKAHCGIYGNEMADKLAQQGAMKEESTL